MNITKFKKRFDCLLKTYLQNKISVSKQVLQHQTLDLYIDYIDNFIFSGGKRIRPYVLYITYIGFGGKNIDAIMRFGIIFELLHTMALIHDDIIDSSDKRHNILTFHRFVQSIIGDKYHHIAEGQAILVGDLLLSWVYEIRHHNHDFSDNLLLNARNNIHSMIEEVILGQMIDVHMMTGEPTGQSNIEKKSLYKSARYTFMRPMLTGAILADSSTNDQKLITKLGESLGLAFQVRDDLKDIFAKDQDKRAFSDIQEGQQTCFTQYVYDNGSENDKNLLQSCMGKTLGDSQILILQKMFANCGAIQYGKDLISQYAIKSNQIVNKINFSNLNAKQEIIHLIEKISNLDI